MWSSSGSAKTERMRRGRSQFRHEVVRGKLKYVDELGVRHRSARVVTHVRIRILFDTTCIGFDTSDTFRKVCRISTMMQRDVQDRAIYS